VEEKRRRRKRGKDRGRKDEGDLFRVERELKEKENYAREKKI